MMALKIAGIIIGAWLVLGLAFIEPSKQLANSAHPGAAAPLTLTGVALVGTGAYVLIRRTIRQGRKRMGVRR